MKTKLFLILVFALSSGLTHSTTIVKTIPGQKEIHVKIVKVNWGDFDAFDLVTDKRIVHHLVCSNNPFFDSHESYIDYVNYYNISVGKFMMENESCKKIYDFLSATFEAINAESPLMITYNLEKMKVERIILPPIDPFQEGPKVKQDKSRKLF